MSAFANIVQLVRAHYEGDESTFASSAGVLARGSKVLSFRNEIERLVRVGRQKTDYNRSQQNTQSSFQQLKKLPDVPERAPSDKFRILTGPAFSDLLLPEETQTVFDEIVTELEFRDELAERGLRARDRILLYGPPGNGKTSSAIAIAKQLGVPCYGVDLAQVVGKYLGDTGRNMKEIFEALPERGVTVLDEIDAIGGSRSAYGSGAADKELNASVNVLLTTLDRSSRGIVIATTNRLDILDDALVRRFEEVVEVPAPTVQQMRALASRVCAGFGVQPPNVDACKNFDAVTKHCKREARRMVMKEILAADAAEEQE